MKNSVLQFPEDALRNVRTLFDRAAAAEPPVSWTPTTGDPVDSKPVSVLHVDQSETPDLTTVRPFRTADVAIERTDGLATAVRQLETSDVDCIIAEYDFREGTGCELLDVVRAEFGPLPFVFFTARDATHIPGERLGQAFTGYVNKGETEQYRLLANRINTLTDHYGLHRRFRRNRAEFEQIRDLFDFALDAASLYLWDWDIEEGTIRRYPETKQLFGLDKTAFEPVFGGYTEYIHPDHRGEVVTTLQSAIQNGSSYQIQYALELPESRRVWIEERGTVLDNEGIPRRAVGASIDITHQKERERELEWERKLNRTLHEALVESRTRSDLEETIVTQVCDYGYDLAWIGDPLGDEIEPRATAGHSEYVDALDRSLPRNGPAPEPIFTAIDEKVAQFVDDLQSGRRTAWRESAIGSGFRAEAALPLVYGDVLYGVLCVYDSDPTVFDQTAQRLLSGLADTLAFVIHNIERKNALASDRIISATLQLVGAEYYLLDVIDTAACDASNTRLMVHETLPYDDERNIQYVSVNGASVEAIVDAAADHSLVDDVTTIASETNPRLQIQHRDRTPESTLTSVGTRVRSTSVTENRADILIEVPNKATLRSAIKALEVSNEFVSVLSSVESDRSAGLDTDPLADLTDRQATVLRAAYHRGYFEQPRESSATDVAQSLGISHPTLLEHLRVAQRKVFQNKFE